MSTLSKGLFKIARHSFNNNAAAPRVAIAGVTGAVGQELLQLIESRNFPFRDIKFLASARSKGQTQKFMGQDITIEELDDNSFKDTDIAFFSCGGSRSKQFASSAVKSGAIVIDNSSAFRMDPSIPLVIPEINPDQATNLLSIESKGGIIANPNCSTIMMNIAIWPIYKSVGIERIVVSTYQAASGAGMVAMNELEQQAIDWVNGDKLKGCFGKQYVWNLFSHNSDIDQKTGYNEEELKMINETRKIFNNKDMKITATCVRVPVLRAHCESINLTLKKGMKVDEVKELLNKAEGVRIVDDRDGNKFPEPIDASFGDDCLVGRIRQDLSQDDDKGLELFISCDQIRKGAALNAVQIAELLCKSKESMAL